MCEFKRNSFIGMLLVIMLCAALFLAVEGQSDWQYEPALRSEFVTVPNIDVEALNQENGLKISSLAPSELAIGNLDKEEGKEIVVAESRLPLIYIFRNGQVEYHLLEDHLSRPRTFPLQPGIKCLALGDLNNDGRDEIVVSVGPWCSILVLSYSEGHIQVTWERYFDGRQIGAIAVADLDGNGLTDLVTCGGVFYQHTHFEFSDFTPFPGTYQGEWDNDVKVADLDGDGLLDVVRSFHEWGCPAQSGFEILFQEAPGAFEKPMRYWVPYAVGGIAVGDVNNDGLKDIIVPESKTDGHLVVFLQDSGGFAAPVVYRAYENPASPVVIDINRDGLMDVVLLNSSWNRITCFYQNKNHRLNRFTLYRASVGDVENQALQVDDLDGDGNLDFVCIGADDNLLCIVTDLPSPAQIVRVSVSPSERYLPLLATYQTSHDYFLLSLRRLFSEENRRLVIDPDPCAIALGDVDGDGIKEIVVGDGEWPVVYVCDGSTVSVHELGVSPWPCPGWPCLVSLAVGDLNDDARDDVAVYVGDALRGGKIVILAQSSNGDLVKETVISADKSLVGIAIGDLNQDGLNDIVTAVGVYYQLPSHAFSEISLFPGDYTSPRTTIVVDVEVSDLNSDGRLDVVRTCVHESFLHEDSRLVIRRTAGFEVLLRSDGDFEPPVFYEAPTSVSLGAEPQIAVGDVNHDGAEDVVLCVEGKLYVFPQDGVSLKEPIEYGVLEYPRAPIIADVNGDGLNDVVICDGWDRISVLYQDEPGCLGSPATYFGSIVQHPGPEALGAGDIDGDGRVDLVSVANYHDGVRIFPHCKLVEPELHTEDDKEVYWQGVLAKFTRPIPQALALRKLGDCYLSRGEYEKALEYTQRSAGVSAEAGFWFWTGLSLNDAGIIYFLLGLYDQAFTCWEQALSVFDDLDCAFGERAVYRNLGLLYFLQRDLTSALEYWSACYKIDIRMQESLAVPVEQRVATRAAAIELNNMAVVQALAGKHEQSLRSLSEALILSRGVQDKLLEAFVFGNFGVVYSMMEQYGHAMVAFYKALAIIEEEASPQASGLLPFTEIRWMIEFNIGLSYEERDQLVMAISHYKKAITLIETMRQSLSHEVFKIAYQQKTKVVYEHLINLFYLMGEGASAFSYAERCRARTFLDLLAQGPMGTIENVVEAGIKTGVVEPEAIERDVQEVTDSLPPDTAVLEYFVTQGAVYLWVIVNGAVSAPFRIETPRETLLERVLAFREEMESPFRPEEEGAARLEILRQARDLYDLLVAPVAEGIAGFKHLVIIPSGPLYYLPFAALYDCPECEGRELLGGEHLVEQFSISYLPSLTILKYTWTLGEGMAEGLRFLGVADPVSGNPRFPPLPGAREEVQKIAGLFPEAEVYVGHGATEEVVRSRFGAARYVDLATHGYFNPHNPMFSYLLLTPGEEGDGKLHTYEVLWLDLGAELVTLSACETLLPSLREAERQVRQVQGASEEEPGELPPQMLERITAGDELVGLTRAFLYAGTPTVLSSLWSVYSEPTKELMVMFYRFVSEQRMNKAEALRQAQLALLKGRYPHPVYWAAFQLVGDWR